MLYFVLTKSKKKNQINECIMQISSSNQSICLIKVNVGLVGLEPQKQTTEGLRDF